MIYPLFHLIDPERTGKVLRNTFPHLASSHAGCLFGILEEADISFLGRQALYR